MLVIRLFRIGKKRQPSFKIVVTDKRNSPCGGRFVEQVGFYNPLTKEKVLKKNRINYWLSVGAKPSPTVHNLLVSEKILETKKIPVHKKSKKETGQEAPAQQSASTKPSELASAEAASIDEEVKQEQLKSKGEASSVEKSPAV